MSDGALMINGFKGGVYKLGILGSALLSAA